VDKLGRKYSLSIQTPEGLFLTIANPFTVEFDITRNILSSANTSSIRIYNLNENHRRQIFKDQFDYDVLKLISFKAGYGQNIPEIFNGNVSRAWSVREGVNFITQVESYDGGYAFANSVTNSAFPAGSNQKEIIENLVKSLGVSGVSPGVVGKTYDSTLQRGSSYSGSTTDILKTLTGGGFFVDNGKAHCLADDECIQGEIETIDSSVGLLGTPVREETYLRFDMIFEPRMLIGQAINLKSSTGASYNGLYKVVGVKHRGMISDAICGDAITTVELFYGAKSLTVIKQ